MNASPVNGVPDWLVIVKVMVLTPPGPILFCVKVLLKD